MAKRMLRIRDLTLLSGQSRSNVYYQIGSGLLPELIKWGKCSSLPEEEWDAIARARIEGRSDEEIRKLVKRLELARKDGAHERRM